MTDTDPGADNLNPPTAVSVIEQNGDLVVTWEAPADMTHDLLGYTIQLEAQDGTLFTDVTSSLTYTFESPASFAIASVRAMWEVGYSNWVEETA